MATTRYTVAGMTCDHCAASVTEEVREVPGVTAVTVDVASGRLDVHSDHPVAAAHIRAAVEEAGYQLVAN